MANTLITMIKGDSQLINNTEILEGQVLFNETDKTISLDEDNSHRVEYCGNDNANPNIAYVESGMVATRGYPKGSFVILNGQLYKVLTQINSGTTFVIDTNVEATMVGIELGRSVTQAEYDALPAAQKNQGVWYITDSGSIYHIDTELSTTSANPVQNKVITNEINSIKSDLTKSIKVTTNAFSATVGTLVTLGALSTLSDGAITDASELKGMGLIVAVGSYDCDYDGTIFLNGNNVVYNPHLTQPNCACTIFLLY